MGLGSCEAKRRGGRQLREHEAEFRLPCGMELHGRGGNSDGLGGDEGQGSGYVETTAMFRVSMKVRKGGKV